MKLIIARLRTKHDSVSQHPPVSESLRMHKKLFFRNPTPVTVCYIYFKNTLTSKGIDSGRSAPLDETLDAHAMLILGLLCGPTVNATFIIRYWSYVHYFYILYQ